MDYLTDPGFWGVSRLSVLSFENWIDRNVHTGYYLSKVKIKDYSVMIDGRNLFDQPIKNDKITFGNIRKVSTGQGRKSLLNWMFTSLYLFQRTL